MPYDPCAPFWIMRPVHDVARHAHHAMRHVGIGVRHVTHHAVHVARSVPRLVIPACKSAGPLAALGLPLLFGPSAFATPPGMGGFPVVPWGGEYGYPAGFPGGYGGYGFPQVGSLPVGPAGYAGGERSPSADVGSIAVGPTALGESPSISPIAHATGPSEKPVNTPEPSSLAIMAAALVALAVWRRARA